MNTGLGPRFPLPPVRTCPEGAALAIAPGNGIKYGSEEPPALGSEEPPALARSLFAGATGLGGGSIPTPPTDMGRHTVLVVVGGGSPLQPGTLCKSHR